MPVTAERPSFSELSSIERRRKLQVGERLTGRIPFCIIQDTEENWRIARYNRIPGTTIRVSPDGDIFYPVWRERVCVDNPEDFLPLSRIPKGWSLERFLESRRTPVSEIVFHQVSKDGGTVDVALRSIEHVLTKYQDEGRELEQVARLEGQVELMMQRLQGADWVDRANFLAGFNLLYRQTLTMLEENGMTEVHSSLKIEIGNLMKEASWGRDRLGRRNPMVMMGKLQAAVRRIGYRRQETEFVVDKFETMRQGLIAQRERDIAVLKEARHQFSSGFAGHEAFSKGKTTQLQQEVLLRKMGELDDLVGQVMVKPFKTVTIEVSETLGRLMDLVQAGNYREASQIFPGVLAKVNQTLAEN